MAQIFRGHFTRIAVLLIAAGCYLLVRPAEPTADQLATLARSLEFERSELQPIDNGTQFRSVRQVNPALTSIDSWISSVGAAVALGDLDGDALSNDVCLVDPRNDSVTLRPAPGTGDRFPPFALPVTDEGYDRGTVAPMGCLLDDLNEDGRTDVLIYYWGRTPVAFLSSGAGSLGVMEFKVIEIVPQRERWFTNAALIADIDGDGHADLVFGNYFRDGSRILDPNATRGAEMPRSLSRAYNGGHKHLLLWAKSTATAVTYVDATAAFPPETAISWTLALGARDLDGDLRPEIYIANDFGPDRLLHNRSRPGRPAFAVVEGKRDLLTPRSKVLGRDSFKGMGVDFADVNHDMLPDIAVSNIARPYALIESHFLFVHTGDSNGFKLGRAPYRDESFDRGTWISDWAWDIRFADLDNDGAPEILQAIGFVSGSTNRWPELQELAMANDELVRHPSVWPGFSSGADLSGTGHDRLFKADNAGRYHDVSRFLGLTGPSVSRGIGVADVDGDGRLDIAIARQWMPSIFLRNTSSGAMRSLVLDLRIPVESGSRSAIGARATVVLPDGRLLSDDVDGGSGHSGKRAPEIHFGLGDVPPDVPLQVEICWRTADGVHERRIAAPAGRHRVVLVPPSNDEVEPPDQSGVEAERDTCGFR